MLTGYLDILRCRKGYWIIFNVSRPLTTIKKFGLFTQKFDIVIKLNLKKLQNTTLQQE
jgi:hypothetical protein